MTNNNKAIEFLKSFGWSEDRCVDVSNMKYGLNDDSGDMKYIGDKFHMFEAAKKFLEQFGGLEITYEKKHKSFNKAYWIKIGGNKTETDVYSFKWYSINLKRMLYPVAEHCDYGTLMIDEAGNFYFVKDCYICKAGNDFFAIVNDFLSDIRKVIGTYTSIPDNEEVGYSDEFIEQWNYDFDTPDNISF